MLTVGAATSTVLDAGPASSRGVLAGPRIGRCVPLFRASPLGEAGSAPARESRFVVDDLLVSHLVHGPRGLRRSRRQVAADGVDDIAVQVHLDGCWLGHADDASALGDPDHITVLDLGRPSAAVTTAVDALWVVVPRHRLQGAFRTGPGVRRLDVGTPRGRLLRSCVDDVWARRRQARLDGADRAARDLVAALRLALGAEEREPVTDALGAAVKSHVLADLEDLALDPASLTETFHCSRATLYRLFREDGGVLAYMRDRRLDRCLDELLDPGLADAPVGETATRWGFESPSHFHRLFTARFGVTPSAVKVRPPSVRPLREVPPLPGTGPRARAARPLRASVSLPAVGS